MEQEHNAFELNTQSLEEIRRLIGDVKDTVPNPDSDEAAAVPENTAEPELEPAAKQP